MLVAGLYEKMNGDIVGWLLKLDMQGDTIWSKKYQKDLDFTKFLGVEKWDKESYIILSSAQDTSFFPSSKPQAWLVKIDLEGNIIWDRLVGAYPDQEDSHTYVYDFEFAPDNGILLTGYVINSDIETNGIKHRNDAWLAKTDSCGYTVGDLPEPMLIVDSIIKNKVYITDQSQNYCTVELNWGDGSEEINYYAYENNKPLSTKKYHHTFTEKGNYTIKTTALAGEEYRDYEVHIYINDIGVGIEDVIQNQEAITIFPNPANDYVIIQHTASQATSPNTVSPNSPLERGRGVFTATITNLNGKQIKSINLNPKLYQQKVDVSIFNNGIYFVRFEIDGQLVGTEKLVVAR